jgi:hypothetical protein
MAVAPEQVNELAKSCCVCSELAKNAENRKFKVKEKFFIIHYPLLFSFIIHEISL